MSRLVKALLAWAHAYTENRIMNQKLKDSVDALVEEVSESNGKLESIRTFLEGVPDLVATAVETALAAADVDSETAAAQVDEAREAVSDNVDATLAAIDANRGKNEEPLDPEAEDAEDPLDLSTEDNDLA